MWRGVIPGLSVTTSLWHEPDLRHLSLQSVAWVMQLHLEEPDISDGTSHFSVLVNEFSKNWQTEQSPETIRYQQRLSLSASKHTDWFTLSHITNVHAWSKKQNKRINNKRALSRLHVPPRLLLLPRVAYSSYTVARWQHQSCNAEESWKMIYQDPWKNPTHHQNQFFLWPRPTPLENFVKFHS